jgi:hypothetical protein
VKLLPVREGLERKLYLDLKNFLYSLNNRQVLVLFYTGELYVSDTYNFCTLRLKNFDGDKATAVLELSGWINTEEIGTLTIECKVV